jgi:hypothetical protein
LLLDLPFGSVYTDNFLVPKLQLSANSQLTQLTSDLPEAPVEIRGGLPASQIQVQMPVTAQATDVKTS